jgi:hypothetical protein
MKVTGSCISPRLRLGNKLNIVNALRKVSPRPSYSTISCKWYSHMKKQHLDGTVAAPTPGPLHRVEHATCPVLDEVRNVAQGVAVREEIPSTCTVAAVVEPRPEDKVGSDAQKGTTELLADIPRMQQGQEAPYMMNIHVKKPQWLLPSDSPSSPLSWRLSQACFVCQVSRRMSASLASLTL